MNDGMVLAPPMTFRLLTPRAPGAVAMISCTTACEGARAGDEEYPITQWLARITGKDDWRMGSLRLVHLAGDVDEGIAVMLSPTQAWLMPHGGLRIIDRIRDFLIANGAVPGEIHARPYHGAPDADDLRAQWPEADDPLEALMLWMIPQVASPAGVNLLLQQPQRWRTWISSHRGADCADRASTPAVTSCTFKAIEILRRRAHGLRHLIAPAAVVVVGAPNAGKSTLVNALAGRDVAITSDQHGTTRDYIGSMLDLEGLVVRWYDTPGRRVTDDPIEQEAIALSQSLIDQADLLIAVTAADSGPDFQDTGNGFAESLRLGRAADLHVGLKADLLDTAQSRRHGHPAAATRDCDLTVSARTGAGMAELVQRVNEALVPLALRQHPDPWLFHPFIEELL